MARKHFLLCAVAAALLILPIAPDGRAPFGTTAAQAQEAEISVSFFYDALADEGDWVRYQPYGYVWVPTDVPADWRPYTHGRWAYTDQYGWTFMSDEPFAWAVYHYGRWGFDEEIGWFWVPGTVWAPAWVSWRRSSDVIGWAPLPPEGEGYAVSSEVEYSEPPREDWYYCETREFLAPDLAIVIVYDDTWYGETEYLGPVVVHNDIVVNDIITVDSIERVVSQPVPVTRVEVVRDPREAEQVRVSDRVVAVQGKLAAAPKKARPPRVVDATAVKPPTKGQKVVSMRDRGEDRQAKPKGRVEEQVETASPQPMPGIEPGPGMEPGLGIERRLKKSDRADRLRGNVAEPAEGAPPKPMKTKKAAQSRTAAGTESDRRRDKVKPGKLVAPEVAGETAPLKVKPGKPPKAGSGAAGPAGKTASTIPDARQAQKKLKKQASVSQEAGRKAAANQRTKQTRIKKPGSVNQAAQGQAVAAKAPKANKRIAATTKANKRIAATAPAPKRPNVASTGPRKPSKVGLPPSQEKTASIPKPKAAMPAAARQAKPAAVQNRPPKPKACNPKQHAAGKC